MSDTSKRLSDLEAFVFGSPDQPIEEVISDLRDAGIDTDRAASRIQKMVQEKHQTQLRKLSEVEANETAEYSQFEIEIADMPRDLILASIKKLRNADESADVQELAGESDSAKDLSQLSDEELRGWLSEITKRQQKSDDDS
ncbi:hypothetical protein [Blastopirellula marina]|uniref:Uncharacterized protein n=1 Tax=Blastopirellula marina TaxID=124 RepID=A0A2S8FAF9_9BACT|nr:hypothetical protein [Blastopirellula marina]PQO28914.1 hypothetical protein C5Y98_24450 [Blastopirellula marina]PTL42187.1 hypothetical protein C5Y97_24465 [Blastopirellula marina]